MPHEHFEHPEFPDIIPPPRSMRTGQGSIDLHGGVRYRGPCEALAVRLLARAMSRHGLQMSEAPGATLIHAHRDDSLASQAYTLVVDGSGVHMRTADDTGLRHALVTLAQLLEQYHGRLPRVEIEDAPAFPTRGLMLDISRDKSPTLASLFAMVDHLESLKINHLQLYTEHMFAYQGHDQVWENCSPMTPDEARALAAHCASRGVDLAANQNCLGHLHRWFRYPAYAPLAEIQGDDTPWIFETDDGRSIRKRGPFSLCPVDYRSVRLISDLLGQLLPLFPSSLANIGFDEAYDLGQGRSREMAATRTRRGLYMDFLRAVCGLARQHNKRPMFWADMLLKDATPGAACNADAPHHAPPADALPLLWGYEADTPFSQWSDALRSVGFECWVCPGTSSWLSITGRTRVRTANLAQAGACAGRATGFLVTDWGDQGHRQHWPVALHAICHGASTAWNPDGPFSAAAASRHIFRDPTGAIAAFLQDLGDVHSDLSEQLGLRNRSALYAELHRPIASSTQDHGDQSQWQEIRNHLATLRGRFGALSCPADPTMIDELDHTLRTAEHAADKAIVTRVMRVTPGRGGAALIRLAADMGSIVEDHRALWLRRNRPGGLDDSAAWYERIIDDYEHPEAGRLELHE